MDDYVIIISYTAIIIVIAVTLKQRRRKILEVYLKKLPIAQNPSFGQGWSGSPEDLNNLPWRLAGGRERTTGGSKGAKGKGMDKTVSENEG